MLARNEVCELGRSFSSEKGSLAFVLNGGHNERHAEALKLGLRALRRLGQQAGGILKLLADPRRHHRELLLKGLVQGIQFGL